MASKSISQLTPTTSVLAADLVVVNHSNTTQTTTVATLSSYIVPATANGYGTRTVSTGTPTGGVDGDVWYQY